MGLFDEDCFSGDMFQDTEVSRVQIENKVFYAKDKTDVAFIRLKNLTEALPMDFIKHDNIHIISNGSFGGIEMLKYMDAKLNIKELYITIYSYNMVFLELIEDFLNAGIKINIKCDAIYRNRKRAESKRMDSLLQKYENLSYTLHFGLHSKIMLIKSDTDSVVIESSANCSNNKRIEQYYISKNVDLYNFHKEWINQIKIDAK